MVIRRPSPKWVFRSMLAALLLVSAWVRLRDIGSSAVLQDAIGPFWAAMRLDGRTHTPGYGLGLLLQYWFLLAMASSLWTAVCGLAWIHALVAVVGAWFTRVRLDGSLLATGLVGVVLASDQGLVGSVLSGAEGYLAPLWVGAAVACTGSLAWIAFAFAVANHPLAACTLPLMLRSQNFHRSGLPGLAIAAGMIAHQLLGIEGGGVPDSGVPEAWIAAWRQSPSGAIAMVCGPLLGLRSMRTRPLAMGVIGSATLLCLVGMHVDYLRDHHLRLLMIPAVACWAAAPRVGAAAVASAWMALPGLTHPPEVALRAGTLNLNTALADRMLTLAVPVVVDRAWLSGGPGAEPAGVMLDLYLRGWNPDQFKLNGHGLIIVAADEGDPGWAGVPGRTVLKGHGFAAVHADLTEVRTWSATLCESSPKLGGAWDALSALNPSLTVADVQQWWACSPSRGTTR